MYQAQCRKAEGGLSALALLFNEHSAFRGQHAASVWSLHPGHRDVQNQRPQQNETAYELFHVNVDVYVVEAIMEHAQCQQSHKGVGDAAAASE